MVRKVLFWLLLAACLTPWVGSSIALVLGAVLALGPGNPHEDATAAWSKRLLQVSVVGLGFGIGFGEVARVGSGALVYTAVGIAATFALAHVIWKILGGERRTAVLVAMGTAICGGSAIAAMSPVIRAKRHETGVALATVFTLNAIGLLVFPMLGRLMDLDQATFGVWAALAIHDTSSVVGAASAYGERALEVATTVKLARALWIVPVVLVAGVLVRHKGAPRVPLFLIGFVAAAGIRSLVPSLDHVWDAIFVGARRLLVVTIFLIGAGLTREVLSRAGSRPMVLGVVLWVLVSAGSLGAIRLGWVPIP